MNINTTFRRNDMQKIAFDMKARDIQSTQLEIKDNYIEIENQTQEMDNEARIEE